MERTGDKALKVISCPLCSEMFEYEGTRRFDFLIHLQNVEVKRDPNEVSRILARIILLIYLERDKNEELWASHELSNFGERDAKTRYETLQKLIWEIKKKDEEEKIKE
jgi:hypothetical protein